MNQNISELLNDSSNTWKQQRKETKSYVDKWQKSGLLEGITKEYDQHNVAILLENQARQLVYENNTTSPDQNRAREDWNGVALPLVLESLAKLAQRNLFRYNR